jgi:membrane-bound serine protease (ClpP class)
MKKPQAGPCTQLHPSSLVLSWLEGVAVEPKLALAYLLIVAGIFLLVAELFLPSSGVLLALSAAAIVIGVAMTFHYSDPATGMITLIAVFVIVPAIGGLMLHYWPKTRMGKRLFLSGPEEDATLASMPVNLELEELRGRFGKAVSALRPAGVVDFDGRRVDTITEGMMVEPGQWVRCIDVKSGKVIVRAVEKPDLGDLETAFFS